MEAVGEAFLTLTSTLPPSEVTPGVSVLASQTCTLARATTDCTHLKTLSTTLARLWRKLPAKVSVKHSVALLSRIHELSDKEKEEEAVAFE
jgi:hypothetical protein